MPTMRTAADLGRLASGSPTMNLTTLPTRRPSRSAVGKSTTAAPGARRFIIRPEITLNRFTRKPARAARSVTAVSSGAGATRPDGKMADDAAISTRAHCPTSGIASIRANARPGYADHPAERGNPLEGLECRDPRSANTNPYRQIPASNWPG